MNRTDLDMAVQTHVFGYKTPYPVAAFSSYWTYIEDVVRKMASLDWRLTLTSPGGFTDEGLGGGDPKDKPWTAVFKRPLPEQREDEDYLDYWKRVEGINDTGYATGPTAPVAVCLAAVKALGHDLKETL